MKRKRPPKRRLPSKATLIAAGSALVLLLAIAIPMRIARNRRAAIEACFARMGRLADAMFRAAGETGSVPQSLSEGGALAKGEVVICPHPQSADPKYIYVLPFYSPNPRMRTEDGTTVAYCVEHLRFADRGLAVPLEGPVNYISYPKAAMQVDASKLERWIWRDGKWTQIPETGVLPVFPEVWRFPGAPWPPRDVR